MTEQPKGRLTADAGAAKDKRGRAKAGLEIDFDPLADPALEVAGALAAADPPDPFARAADPDAGTEPDPKPGPEPRDTARPDAGARAAAGTRGAGGRAGPVRAAPAPSAADDGDDDAADDPAPEPMAMPDPRARQRAADAAAERLGLPPTLARIDVTVTVEVGRTRMTLSEIASVVPGELVELDRMTEEPVDVLVNGRLFARGEVVALGAAFGVRLLELVGDPA
jgi:flagellar motor switch protein FliN/FliY